MLSEHHTLNFNHQLFNITFWVPLGTYHKLSGMNKWEQKSEKLLLETKQSPQAGRNSRDPSYKNDLLSYLNLFLGLCSSP